MTYSRGWFYCERGKDKCVIDALFFPFLNLNLISNLRCF
uniref:Uncharacterized protein n=1 Tax=Lepeophtheirus salmonis TaxID=72036 RepID=A0A0K2T9S4_LEPSM